MIWVGTDDGLIQLTRNGGGAWSNVTPHDMPEWGAISMIEPSRYDANTAYVAVDRHKLDDIKPHAYKTSDGGKTWIRIDDGLPEGAFVHAVREDTVKRGLLYAATETGVFVSFDDGGHWQSLQINLPRSPVHDLVVKGDDLVVATHGRSFWILDDVTPLRQVAQASAATSAFLYTPQTGYRLYYPDEVDARPPVGQEPAGWRAHRLLSARTGQEHSDHRHSRRQGRRGAPPQQRKSKKAEQPPEWPDQVHPTDTLPAQQGMNRFVWNLRYGDPVQIPGAFYAGLEPRGPIALPGKYTIKLSYGGQSQSVPLTIAADPARERPTHRAAAEIRAIDGGLSRSRRAAPRGERHPHIEG